MNAQWEQLRPVLGRWGPHLSLGALLWIAVLAIGGSTPRIALALSLAAALLTLGVRKRLLPVSGAWITLALLGVATLLQTLPLPLSLLDRLSPQTADVWARCLYPLSQSVSHGALSLDPGASLVEAAKWLAYACVFQASASLARQSGLDSILLLVLSAACALALATLGHGLLDAKTVFGLYEPRNAVALVHIGPLLNPNNLAGYLNLGAFAGLGLALGSRTAQRRWFSALATIVIMAVSLRSASRGGALSLAIGVVVFSIGMAMAARRRSALPPRVAVASLGAVLFCGLGLSLLGADRGYWAELLSENRTKLSLFQWAAPMIEDYRWFGVGRGAFESAFPARRPAQPLNVVFTHPENIIVQWLSEWGLVVALLALVAFAVHLWPRGLRAFSSPVRLGAWTGVVVLVLHNMVDLGLELTGVAFGLFATLGALWGTSRRPRTKEGKRARLAGRLKALPALLCAGVAVFTLIRDPQSVDAERDAVQALLGEDGTPADPERFAERVRAAMLAHPADPYFPLAGAVASLATRSGDPMPWLQRALERGPTIGRTHLALAEALRRKGARTQALLELRLAVEYEPGLAPRVAQDALRSSRSAEALLSVVPDSNPAVLAALSAAANQAGEPELREHFDSELLSRDPTNWSAHARLAEVRLQALPSLNPPCADAPSCEYEIAAHAHAIADLRGNSALPFVLLAQLALAQDDSEEAALLLDEGCGYPEGRAPCLALKARVLGDLRRDKELDLTLKALVAESCVTPEACASVHERIAALRSSLGHDRLAVASLERAAREQPTLRRYLDLADAAERAGMNQVLIESLQQATKLQSDPQAFADRIQRARRVLTREVP